jgi:hypothetical protein
VNETVDLRLRSKMLAIALAFAVFVVGVVLVWQAFGRGGVARPDRAYPSPPASGYYVLFPEQAEQGSDAISAEITAITNLPDGTLMSISTTNEGSCCPPVKDGKLVISTQNSACYGFVGAGNSPGFTAEVTAQPDFRPWAAPGASNAKPPEQPVGVLDILGRHFENLSGDQVVDKPDGSKWLVAEGAFTWPEPQCGADPIPLFGGPKCDPEEQQLQGEALREAMEDVMGMLSQGRMCEFWSVLLPPDVEATHPWPEFAAEWREWLMRQDFSDAQPTSGWQEGALRWQLAHREGDRYIVEVIHDGQAIATLELRPLPDHCPSCSPSVVPFWGVMDWDLQ